MIALYIITAIILLIAALMFTPIWVRITYNDGLCVKGGIGFVGRTLFPVKRRSVRISDYSPEALRKKRLKIKREALKKSKKSKKQTSTESGNAKQGRGISNVRAMLRYITRTSFTLVKKFGGYLNVNIKSFVITVATGDAAQTAVTYGAVSQLASYLFALLESRVKITYPSDSAGIEADFTAESWSADIDVVFRLRVWHIIALGVKTLELMNNK